MLSTGAPDQPRPICDRCRRPASACYCAAVPRLETRTRVVILQHPRERRVAIGTARMASLCLPGSELHVGVRWDDSAPLARALADPARPPILLYPGPGARDVLADPPPGPVTLVVVDGTWSQARTVVRDNPVLRALPRYAFVTPEPSRYRIRREPDEAYVSTIEALMHVLGALEGDPDRFRAMIAPLAAMVDTQLACQARNPGGRGRKPRVPRPLRDRLPPELSERWDDLVCVAGEANAWPYRDGAGPPDELVQWVAERVATGERFAAVAAPAGPLSPTTRLHTELDDATVLGGVPLAELVAGFADFARPSDVVCAWGHYSPSLFGAAGGALPVARVDVRAAAKRLTNRRFGSLEDYAATVGPAPTAAAPGRGGRRLALLVQVLAAWRAALVAGAPAR